MKHREKNHSQRNRQLTLQPLQPRCLMAADFGAEFSVAGPKDSGDAPAASRTLWTEKVSVGGAMDYGDAPASYGTLLSDDGARHILSEKLRLGKEVDAEYDGQPSGSALLDGADEDGVRFLGPFAAVTGRGALDAWADTNGDGKFDDSEKFIDAVQLFPGENYFLAPDAEYYRFRVSEKGGLDATGFGGLGEVEDYYRGQWRWCPPHDVPPPDSPGDPGDPNPIPEELTRRDRVAQLVQDNGRRDERTGDDENSANQERSKDDEYQRSTSLETEHVDQLLKDNHWR